MAVVFLLASIFLLWQKYGGLWLANRPAKENITNLIENVSQTPRPGENTTQLPLKIPDGYSISIYAKDLINPRDLIQDPNGNILVSITSSGKVISIINGNSETVVSNLNNPHGLAFNGNKLYIAETNSVSIYDYDLVTHKTTNKKKIIDLPSGGGHFTRSLLIKENKLYVSTGSSCNVCIETDPKRASIWYSNLDGSDLKPFATGLRNSVFMTLNPKTNEIWATNMGRDFLGDNLPPETVNIIRQEANYGWPFCYGNKITDNETNSNGSKFDCSKMSSPELSFQAHSAPLGLAFLGNDLLVAYHGSWNRSAPTGYKVVRFHNGKEEDFITGWLQPDGNVLGRPVDILVRGEGIYISDDKAGVIYLLKKV